MILRVGQTFHVVDAFTDRPFAGNPAAVCVMDAAPADPGGEAWMRNVAREMNLAETAFLHPAVPAGGNDSWNLRWFTPTVEVDLCGHATIASAHVLWQTERAPAGRELRFQTRSGELRANQGEGLILLDFPSMPPTECAPPPGLEAALGTSFQYTGSNQMDLLVLLGSAADVRACRPDMGALERLPGRGFMITAAADEQHEGADFISRFFGPGVGIPEDLVTGSAHCALGPFWGARLGKTRLTGYQASSRGGTVHVELRGERVLLGGAAVTVSRGEILGPPG